MEVVPAGEVTAAKLFSHASHRLQQQLYESPLVTVLNSNLKKKKKNIHLFRGLVRKPVGVEASWEVG